MSDLSAAPDLGSLTFRQDYFGDQPAWIALVALLQDTFGIDVGIQERLGGPDPTSVPFAYFDGDGTCVANFTVFSMPMIIKGRPVKSAGFQSGAVRPQWRGKGLYRDMMNRAFGWCDAQGSELGLLLTGKPALYQPSGFKILPQHRFCGAPPSSSKPAGSSRLLSMDDAGDLTLVRRLLRERMPVSSIFAVVAQAEMFLLNSVFDSDVILSLLDDLDVAVAWKPAGPDCIRLLDIAGEMIPSLAAILAALDQSPRRLEVCFPPDRLDWQGTPEPLVSGTCLMVRGSIVDLIPQHVMLSPMAGF